MSSIQVGSGKRFATPDQRDTYSPDVSTAQLRSPPPPRAFSGLKSGPDFSTELEPNLSPAVDGSADLLRNLSPFMFQVEPPLVFADTKGVSSQKSQMGTVLDAAHSNAPQAFRSARNAIEGSIPGGSLLSEAKSVEQFVAQGQMNKAYGPDGLETRDLEGRGASRLGAPTIADLNTAVDITMQLRALVQTPPLVLLINPQTLSMSYNKVQQFTERSRFGFIFQAWGEEQPRLSVEARCGAFISGTRGVQWASRRDSAAWQNLATAFQFYKNNGYIYDTIGKSNAHHFVGSISIHYDQWVYYGNMESFNYSFDESTQNGGVTFSLEFVVNAMVDTSKTSLVVTPMRSPIPSLSDPRYSGMDNRAGPSEGDVQVDLPEVALGVSGTLLGNIPRVTSDGQAVPGVAGFQAVGGTVAPSNVPVKKLAPFRVR